MELINFYILHRIRPDYPYFCCDPAFTTAYEMRSSSSIVVIPSSINFRISSRKGVSSFAWTAYSNISSAGRLCAIFFLISSVAFRTKCKIFSRYLQNSILKTEKGRFKGL